MWYSLFSNSHDMVSSLMVEDRDDLEKPLRAPGAIFEPLDDHASRGSRTRRFLCSIKPAILSSSSKSSVPPRLRGSTAYLDGLRGWAAFLVYITHHILACHMWLPLEMGYGYKDEYFFLSTPLIRTLFTGSHMAVHIFFVISGYVLTRGTLQHIHSGSSGEKIASGLASAVSRRYVRLWLPIAATTFLTMTVGYMVNQRGVEQAATYPLEIAHWVESISLTAFPLSTVSWMDYNPHTWTIPYEFRGSMYVFLALLATHRMTRRARMSLILGLALWTHRFAAWGASTFLMGTFLAELDLMRDEDWPAWRWLVLLQRHKGKLFALLIPFALHLGGQPALAFGSPSGEEYLDAWGFHYLGLLIPGPYLGKLNDFWYTPGAVIVVVAVTHVPVLRRVFEMRFPQYLGHISYGFYLVHGPVMFILGERLYAAVGVTTATSMPISAWNGVWAFGKDVGPVGLEVNFLSCHLVLLPLTFYLAELCTVLIDEPSVRLARWLYQKTLA